ncbi:MAG: T9SS type A sorting domain-containing protein [Flavobacteriia bacterium]|nr:T9SS type A sorting domain-containing protein [Flavobacteriia bacterium]
MKKAILSTLFALSTLTAFSSHYEGGQVYWEALGNDRYIFYVQLVAHTEPNSAHLPHTIALYTNVPGRTSILLNQPITTRLTQYCSDSTQRNLEIRTFRSMEVTIPEPPQGVRYDFWYEDCCRADTSQINIVGYDDVYYDASMWTAGANRSSGYFDIISTLRNSSTRLVDVKANPGRTDSTISVGMAAVRTANGALATYASGYSKDYPTSSNDSLSADGIFYAGLPDSSFHAVLAFYALKTGQTGNASFVRYTIGMKFLDGEYYSEPTYQYIGSSHPAVVRPHDGAIFTEVAKTDTLRIEFTVQDTSSILSTMDSIQVYITQPTPENPPLSQLPELIPIQSSTSLADTGSIHFVFQWIIPTDLKVRGYSFNIIAENNRCPGNGLTTIPVVVVNNDDTEYRDYVTCPGEAVRIESVSSVTAQWYPSTGLSSSVIKRPWATISSTQTYYYVINGDTAEIHTVYVEEVDTLIASISGNQLHIIDSINFNINQRLYYYYMPVGYTVNGKFPINVDGVYSVSARDDNRCRTVSNTERVANDNWIEFHLMDEHVFDYNASNLNSMKFNIIFQNVPGNMKELHHIVFPGLHIDPWSTTSSISLFLKIGSAGNAIPITATSYGPNSTLVTFDTPFQIDYGTSYRFEFAFVNYDGYPVDDQWPYWISQANIYNGSVGSNQQALLQMVFRGKVGLGEEELDRSISLYPNPASDHIRFEGIEESAAYEIISVNGTTVQVGTTSNGELISTSNLQAGMYIVRLTSDQTYQSFKLIVED